MLVPQTPSCYPTELTVDLARLVQAVKDLLVVAHGTPDWAKQADAGPFYTVNLTHVPGMQGRDRFFKLSAGYDVIRRTATEDQFTEMPPEVASSYLGEVIRSVQGYHQAKFGAPLIGRFQLIWVNPGSCYKLHRDPHTQHRYHVPLWTNSSAWWLFRNGEDVCAMHMPADGRTWYLDPNLDEHTVANMGHSPRCHLLLTTS